MATVYIVYKHIIIYNIIMYNVVYTCYYKYIKSGIFHKTMAIMYHNLKRQNKNYYDMDLNLVSNIVK
jgi:hypothetical protein